MRAEAMEPGGAAQLAASEIHGFHTTAGKIGWEVGGRGGALSAVN